MNVAALAWGLLPIDHREDRTGEIGRGIHQLVCASLASTAHAVEIKFAPVDFAVLHEARDYNVNDLVLHAIGIATKPSESFAIDDIQVALLRGDYLILTCDMLPARALADMSSLYTTPQKYLVGTQLLAADGVRIAVTVHLAKVSGRHSALGRRRRQNCGDSALN